LNGNITPLAEVAQQLESAVHLLLANHLTVAAPFAHSLTDFMNFAGRTIAQAQEMKRRNASQTIAAPTDASAMALPAAPQPSAAIAAPPSPAQNSDEDVSMEPSSEPAEVDD